MILRFIINTIALFAVVNIIPGVSAELWTTLLLTVLVISLLNAILKPILMLLTLPINILTLGLFTLFINAFMFYLASEMIKGFHIESFWSAFLGALLFSIMSSLISYIIGNNARIKVSK